MNVAFMPSSNASTNSGLKPRFAGSPPAAGSARSSSTEIGFTPPDLKLEEIVPYTMVSSLMLYVAFSFQVNSS